MTERDMHAGVFAYELAQPIGNLAAEAAMAGASHAQIVRAMQIAARDVLVPCYRIDAEIAQAVIDEATDRCSITNTTEN
jgi:hypothetical protein